ncbi:ankyrin [Periconia macrospinosa]|uniref:Ankyrin n=1 Tax=Periconia macrospinosa TaxID=97972 RepID=A0A2V1D355_9PLEO|nr:ankyrin [Periconia macrospinosa]
MSLPPPPRLPNEIVDQIVEATCQSYDDFQSAEYLYLRTLNSFYDTKVFKLYVEHVPLHYTLLIEDRSQRQRPIPDLFAACILLDIMKSRCSKTYTKLGSDLYAAADTLYEQCERAGKTSTPESCLRDVCRSLFRARTQKLHHQLSQIYASRWGNRDTPNPCPNDAIQTAFVTAVIMKYEDIACQMLRSGEVSTATGSRILGTPLEPAIKLGYTELTKLILATGVQIPLRPFGNEDWGPSGQFYRAIIVASKKGYLGVLEPFLQRDTTKELTHYVLKFTSMFGNWDIATQILDHHLPRDKWELSLTRKADWDTPNELVTYKLHTVQRVLNYAARDGKDDLFLHLIQSGITPRSNLSGTKTFPLQQAAAGGHLSTCQLLLENGAFTNADYESGTKTHFRNRLDTLVQALARGGNMDILRLFQRAGLWTRTTALPILILAAEHGHLPMAQYAAAHNLDMPVKLKTPHKDPISRRGNDHHHGFEESSSIRILGYPPTTLSFHGGDPLCLHCQRLAYRHDLRQFALLRAVAFGHAHIVEWLVTSLDADPGVRDPEDPPSASSIIPSPARGGPSPLGYAVDTGNIEMVRLLRRLGAEPLNRMSFRPQFEGSGQEAHERCVEFPADVVDKLKLGARCRRYVFAGYRRQRSAFREACWRGGSDEEEDEGGYEDEDGDEDDGGSDDDDAGDDSNVEMGGDESDVEMGGV